MNKLVQLPKPRVSILILEIRSHGPHNVVCPSYVSLRNEMTDVTFLFPKLERYKDMLHKQNNFTCATAAATKSLTRS